MNYTTLIIIIQQFMQQCQKMFIFFFYFSLISGLFFAALLLFFKTYILRNIGTSEKTFAFADSYYSIFTLFLPFSVADIFFQDFYEAKGRQ